MKRRLILLAALVCAFLMAPGTAYASPCNGHRTNGDVSSVTYRCHDTGMGSIPGSGQGGSGAMYVYVWLPACPNSVPGQAGAEWVDCRAAHSCNDPRLWLLNLYSQQRTDAAGHPVKRPWQYVGSACKDRSSIGSTQRRTLSWVDVRSALQRIGPPGSTVQGPAYTLVNLKTTFYSHVVALDRTLDILGFPVHVRMQPISFVWRWGDGSISTTRTAGRPYPATDVTHSWRQHTDLGNPQRLSVDVIYAASYQVSAGPWIRIPENIFVRGPQRDLPVKQASAVLVPGG
jgi:hypothetical protein